MAITPDDEKAYVTNMASGTVSVISTFRKEVIDTIKVGTEPFGCALTPDGRKLYVANQSSDTVSVIDTRRNRGHRDDRERRRQATRHCDQRRRRRGYSSRSSSP